MTIFVFNGWTLAQNHGPQSGVIIIPIESGALAEHSIYPGKEYWVGVDYLGIPKGDVLFAEPAEKIWWLGEQPIRCWA